MKVWGCTSIAHAHRRGKKIEGEKTWNSPNFIGCQYRRNPFFSNLSSSTERRGEWGQNKTKESPLLVKGERETYKKMHACMQINKQKRRAERKKGKMIGTFVYLEKNIDR